jgi:hypothetical protein
VADLPESKAVSMAQAYLIGGIHTRPPQPPAEEHCLRSDAISVTRLGIGEGVDLAPYLFGENLVGIEMQNPIVLEFAIFKAEIALGREIVKRPVENPDPRLFGKRNGPVRASRVYDIDVVDRPESCETGR